MVFNPRQVINFSTQHSTWAANIKLYHPTFNFTFEHSKLTIQQFWQLLVASTFLVPVLAREHNNFLLSEKKLNVGHSVFLGFKQYQKQLFGFGSN